MCPRQAWISNIGRQENCFCTRLATKPAWTLTRSIEPSRAGDRRRIAPVSVANNIWMSCTSFLLRIANGCSPTLGFWLKIAGIFRHQSQCCWRRRYQPVWRNPPRHYSRALIDFDAALKLALSPVSVLLLCDAREAQTCKKAGFAQSTPCKTILPNVNVKFKSFCLSQVFLFVVDGFPLAV